MPPEGAQRENASRPLIDSFGRRITYLRLSVTDRCDLRCNYCMAEDAVFAPKSSILTLEELAAVAEAFIARGVRKIRLTGGEPLTRRNFMYLVDRLSASLKAGRIDELTMTTNGTQLAKFADVLRDAGMNRINISLDTLDREKFASIARRDALGAVLEGIDAAQSAGMKVKINTVALKSRNIAEIPAIIEWAHRRDMDVTLIEVMPLGEIEEDRSDQFYPLSQLKASLGRKWMLTPVDYQTGGPSKYVRVEETGGRIGFITPLTSNFCDGCNRVRVTCSGDLFMCLGRSDRVNLRDAYRAGGLAAVENALDEAMRIKPRAHDFEGVYRGVSQPPTRFMSTTGG